MIDAVISELKKLHKEFIVQKKTGHYIIKLSYYEGGLTKPIKEVSEQIREDRELKIVS